MQQQAAALPWNLQLVRPANPVPPGFVPPLRPVDDGAYLFDTRAADALEHMLSDCRDAGLQPVVCSAYRSAEKQTVLFQRQIEKQLASGVAPTLAAAAAARVVARPGDSEHHLGLACDLVSQHYPHLDDAQADTPEYRWLYHHCHHYGFILRYPQDKCTITQIIYEPWHFRFVGAMHAQFIMQHRLCLEEYLAEYL